MVMVLPFCVAWSPGGKPVAVRLAIGAVPPRTLTVLLKPGWLAVQAVLEGAPRVGVGLMVMEYVPVLVAPVVSRTVSWMLPYVPTAVGMPVKVTSHPTTVALRPGGRLAWELTVSVPVPPLVGMAPG